MNFTLEKSLGQIAYEAGCKEYKVRIPQTPENAAWEQLGETRQIAFEAGARAAVEAFLTEYARQERSALTGVVYFSGKRQIAP